jgi:hypothetical protein
MNEAERIEHDPWPFRAVLLLALGALGGLAIHLLTSDSGRTTEDPLRFGAAAFVAVGGIVFAFSLERLRWKWSAGFALVAGLVAGFVTLWNGNPDGWDSGEGWRFAASLLSVAIAVPLFQAMRDTGRRHLAPHAVHEHVWTNVILWFLAWAFVLLVWLLANMLGGLFHLIGLDFLQRLLRKDWFAPILLGGALGAAVAMLRDRDGVLFMLQRVGRTILSVLAPALAAGLLIFVLALPFTGLGPLWRETEETTPILLACVSGAFVLANAVIGHAAEEEAKARILRWAAMALGAVMLPLAIVAAVSLGKRVGQYGFTPDRLWGMAIVSVAVAVAAAYLLALVWRRLDWARHIRRYNVALAAGVCLLALFLALPIVDFGAISARDQLAMLESGKIAPDKFDWRAMRFDFGPGGLRALERLRDKGAPGLRAKAAAALAAKDFSGIDSVDRAQRKREAAANIRVLPKPVALPPALIERLSSYNHCRSQGPCFVFYEAGADSAVAISSPVCPDLREGGIAEDLCETQVSTLRLTRRGWGPGDPARASDEVSRAQLEALRRNQVEIRQVTRRQVFIGGHPAGEAFE